MPEQLPQGRFSTDLRLGRGEPIFDTLPSRTLLANRGYTPLNPANNLFDVASASTARTNLRLGTTSTQNTGTSGAAIPLLNAANSWSNNQTFANSDIALLESSTGATTLIPVNTGATNYTLTVPAVTDTLTVLGAAHSSTARNNAVGTTVDGPSVSFSGHRRQASSIFTLHRPPTIWASAGFGAIYSFCSVTGCNNADENRTANLIEWTTAAPAPYFESGLGVNTTLNNGYVHNWAASTPYVAGNYTFGSDLNIFLETVATCTSGSTSPSGTRNICRWDVLMDISSQRYFLRQSWGHV